MTGKLSHYVHYTKAINKNTGWTCGSLAVKKTGDAVWKTPWHPSTAESKDPSSSKSALNNWSLSLAPSSASKCSVFFGSPVEYIYAEIPIGRLNYYCEQTI